MIYVASGLRGDVSLGVREELWLTALRVRLRTNASAALAARSVELAGRTRWRCLRCGVRRHARRAADGAPGRVIPFTRALLAR